MQLVPKTDRSPEITQPTEKITLDIGGMKCAGCVRSVERQLTQYPGIVNACVNLATEVAVVESEVGTVKASALAQHLTAAGFPTQPRQRHGSSLETIEDSTERQQREMRSASRQLLVAFLLLALSTLGHFGHVLDAVLPGLNNIWFHCGLATLALLIPGRPILVDGWLGVRRNAPNMNTLVGLGTLTAYIASLVALLFPQLGWECFFDEPVMMLGFILLGRTLEKKARNRAAAAFKNLLALQPQVARLIGKPKGVGSRESGVVGDKGDKGDRGVLSSSPSPTSPSPFNGNVVEIPAEQVRVGEWLQVLPSEKIPVDGEVVYGQTTVDESMLTGEVVPVIKQPGDSVTAGTLNQSGAIAIQSTRTGSDTTLAQIVALVEAAQTRKAPVQKLADTVAGYFTYFVLTAALLTFIFWYFFGTHIWGNIAIKEAMAMNHMHAQHLPNSPLILSLKLAIAVMVVACPCALGLATPTAILVGTAMSAELGLLIKGGDVLEKVHKLDTVVFDKTGTLTTGKPTVSDCILLSNTSQLLTTTKLLQLAAAVERGTCHPLAIAIQQEAEKQQLLIPDAINFYTEPGLGVSALVDGDLVLLGNADWLSWNGVIVDEAAQSTAQALATAGKTVVYLAVAGNLLGLIAVTDTLRPEAKTTVEHLRQMGLRVMILSGDRIEAVSAVAQQLGLDNTDVIAGVPPAKKAAAIQALQQGQGGQGGQGGNISPLSPPSPLSSIVAMVGDGINDAPALSQADVGIALHSGTDVAMETAEIILMRDRLTDVVKSIELSRVTFNKIRQNLFWAFAYNTVGIPLAAGVLLPKLGFVLNPAGAAALMAFSSVSVVTNSLLLRRFIPRSPN